MGDKVWWLEVGKSGLIQGLPRRKLHNSSWQISCGGDGVKDHAYADIVTQETKAKCGQETFSLSKINNGCQWDIWVDLSSYRSEVQGKTLPTCNQNQKNICNHPMGGKKWDDKKGCGETQETVGQESEENRVFQERGHG